MDGPNGDRAGLRFNVGFSDVATLGGGVTGMPIGIGVLPPLTFDM
jgi:hypothetical protein